MNLYVFHYIWHFLKNSLKATIFCVVIINMTKDMMKVGGGGKIHAWEAMCISNIYTFSYTRKFWKKPLMMDK